jgi:chromosomal replication initiation ATPase DnaA
MNLLGIEIIIDAACRQAGVTLEQLFSTRRHADIVTAREIVCVLLRDVRPGVILASQPSFPEITRELHRLNHSTVVTACRRGRLKPATRKHAREVCARLAIPRSHWPAWMVGQGDVS